MKSHILIIAFKIQLSLKQWYIYHDKICKCRYVKGGVWKRFFFLFLGIFAHDYFIYEGYKNKFFSIEPLLLALNLSALMLVLNCFSLYPDIYNLTAVLNLSQCRLDLHVFIYYIYYHSLHLLFLRSLIIILKKQNIQIEIFLLLF